MSLVGVSAIAGGSDEILGHPLLAFTVLPTRDSVGQRQGGLIFSDGVEADYLSFDSVASICVAEEMASLVAT